LLGLAAVARVTGQFSLSDMFPALSMAANAQLGPVMGLIAAAFLIVFLAENARIPVDDPNTHLELTMIHEVMVLDHSGPDLAFILYGAALKLWVLASLIVSLTAPVHTGNAGLDIAAAWGLTLCLAVLVGVIESSMARLRLVRVPRLLVGAIVLAGLSFVLLLR
jgi:formate hydrogenlyase subunit 4